MEYLELNAPEDFRADDVYKAYCNAFPEYERRCEKQFRTLFGHPKSKVLTILDGHSLVGYMIMWHLSQCTFLEHFEILPDYRQKKLGSSAIAELCARHGRILLETEPGNLSETAAARVSFYRNAGFRILDAEYAQPPYGPDKKAVPLWLLGNYNPENIHAVKEEIFDVVYGV